VTAVVVVAVVAALVVVIVVVVLVRRSRSTDGVATFRRQIDALSPEARREVVDKVQALEEDKPDESQA
jgi:preprotein translocase subunit SecG